MMDQFRVSINQYGNMHVYEWVYSHIVNGFTWREVALRQLRNKQLIGE